MSHNLLMNIIRRLGERLSEHPEHLRAQETRSWCAQVSDVEQIAVCRPRTRVRIAGRVQSIKLVPRMNTSSLEVQIWDGTDEVTAIWLGRKKIPGIALGRGLVLEGTIGRYRGDVLSMINPAYELLPDSID